MKIEKINGITYIVLENDEQVVVTTKEALENEKEKRKKQTIEDKGILEDFLPILEGMKKKIELEREKPSFDEEAFVRNLLLAIFAQKQLENREENLKISLQESEKNLYVRQLEELFFRVGLTSDYFCKTPVSEEYDAFDGFFSYVISLGLADYDSYAYNTVEFSMNFHHIHYILKSIADYFDFISFGCMLLDFDFEKEFANKGVMPRLRRE